MTIPHLLRKALFTGAFLLPALAAKASLLYHVSLDTSAFVANPAAPFYLSFQLNDGAGLGDGNNSVFLSGFDFGAGGSATEPPLLFFGAATGSVGTGFTLVDTDDFNGLIQEFVPGALLQFDLTLPSLTIDPAADFFAFGIYYTDPFFGPTPLPTTDPFSQLLTLSLDSSTPSLSLFTIDTTSLDIPPGFTSVGPTVLLEPSMVPEPTTAFVGLALVGLCAGTRRKSRGAASARLS